MFKKKPPKNDELLMVLAAVGIMQDEFSYAVPIDEITFCLRVDFKQKIKDLELLSILNEGLAGEYCIQENNGWYLTSEGASLADEYLANYQI